jgi:hypothetical protein
MFLCGSRGIGSYLFGCGGRIGGGRFDLWVGRVEEEMTEGDWT